MKVSLLRSRFRHCVKFKLNDEINLGTQNIFLSRNNNMLASISKDIL